MINYGLTDRLLGLFGTGSWTGGGVRTLKTFAEQSKWEEVAAPAEIIGRPGESTYPVCDPLGEAMAKRIFNK